MECGGVDRPSVMIMFVPVRSWYLGPYRSVLRAAEMIGRSGPTY